MPLVICLRIHLFLSGGDRAKYFDKKLSDHIDKYGQQNTRETQAAKCKKNKARKNADKDQVCKETPPRIGIRADSAGLTSGGPKHQGQNRYSSLTTIRTGSFHIHNI